MQITITLNEIKKHRPCILGWRTAIEGLGDIDHDQPFPVSRLLDTNGLDNTLWVLRCLPDYEHLWRLYNVWCAKQVAHLMSDNRSLAVIAVAEQYALGLCGSERLSAAGVAAWDAAWDAGATALAARAANAAAGAAALAALDAGAAALDAGVAVWDAGAAALAAGAAALDAGVAAWDAGAAARNFQTEKLRDLLDTSEIEIDGWIYYLVEEETK